MGVDTDLDSRDTMYTNYVKNKKHPIITMIAVVGLEKRNSLQRDPFASVRNDVCACSSA